MFTRQMTNEWFPDSLLGPQAGPRVPRLFGGAGNVGKDLAGGFGFGGTEEAGRAKKQQREARELARTLSEQGIETFQFGLDQARSNLESISPTSKLGRFLTDEAIVTGKERRQEGERAARGFRGEHDVNIARAEAIRRRNQDRQGVDRGSGRAMASNRGAQILAAGQRAQGANVSRQEAENIARNRGAQIGLNLAQQRSGAAGTALGAVGAGMTAQSNAAGAILDSSGQVSQSAEGSKQRAGAFGSGVLGSMGAKGFAEGGRVIGEDTIADETADTVPAKLTENEYVLPADFVMREGTRRIDELVHKSRDGKGKAPRLIAGQQPQVAGESPQEVGASGPGLNVRRAFAGGLVAAIAAPVVAKTVGSAILGSGAASSGAAVAGGGAAAASGGGAAGGGEGGPAGIMDKMAPGGGGKKREFAPPANFGSGFKPAPISAGLGGAVGPADVGPTRLEPTPPEEEEEERGPQTRFPLDTGPKDFSSNFNPLPIKLGLGGVISAQAGGQVLDPRSRRVALKVLKGAA